MASANPTLEERLEEVATDKHLGYERQIANKAKGQCPRLTQIEISELIRDFAIDAAYDFNPNRAATWTTYLRYYLHWRVCKWLRSNTRKPGYMASVAISSSGRSNDAENNSCLQVGKCDSHQAASEVLESLKKLTPPSRQIFHTLVNADVPRVKVLGARRISKITGEPTKLCRQFVDEVKEVYSEC